MASVRIYESMIQPRGHAYRISVVNKRISRYNNPVDVASGRVAGNSRIWGDASPEMQSRAIDALIDASGRAGLSARQTAHVLAIARVESGFNPDAAAGTTSAYGLGQFIKDTGEAYGINDGNRDDVNKQAEALVAHYLDNAKRAREKGQGEEYVYKYHHDGPLSDYGGLQVSLKQVSPYIDRYESFVTEHRLLRDFELHAPYALPEIAPLQLGDQNLYVVWLQENLKHLDITAADGSAIAANGEFGAHTHEAVRAFQRQYGLPVTGVADTTTLASVQVGVRAIESVQAASKFGQEFLPSGYRADWLDRDAQGLPNYLHASHLPGPSAVEHAAAERGPAHQPPTARTPQQHRSDPAPAPQHHYTPPPPVEPAAFAPLPTTQTLEPGDRSAAVQALQQHLQLLGATDRYGQKIMDDKEYGDRTRDAVEQFQLWTGREPTGMADPGTLQALQSQVQFALRQRGQGTVVAPDAHLAEHLKPVTLDRADAAIERPVQGRDFTGLLPFSDSRHPQHGLYIDLQQRFQAKGNDLSEQHLSVLARQMHLGGYKQGWPGDVIVHNGRAIVGTFQLGMPPKVLDLNTAVPSVQDTMATFQVDQQTLTQGMERLQQPQAQAHSHGMAR